MHGLGEDASHWLAVQSLSQAAHFLKELLGNTTGVVTSLPQCQVLWRKGKIGVVDPEAFARDDAQTTKALPKTWEVTSDSLALQLARRWHATRLILLKSIGTLPDWSAKLGNTIVDPWFERLLAENAGQVAVSIVKLRSHY